MKRPTFASSKSKSQGPFRFSHASRWYAAGQTANDPTVAVQAMVGAGAVALLRGFVNEAEGHAQRAAQGARALPQHNPALLAITERFYTNHWYRFWGESALGACLLGQKKYAEAEPLLEAGYQGLKQRYDKYTVYYKARDLRMALNRLIQLCEETAQSAKAAQLKLELADFEKREGGPPPGPGAPP